MKTSVSLCLLASTTLLLSACSLNPFSSDKSNNPMRDEVRYRCDDNKRFDLKMANQGKNAWVIFDHHQVNLDLQGADADKATPPAPDATRVYQAGDIKLTMTGDTAELVDGEKGIFTACKPPMPPVEEK